MVELNRIYNMDCLEGMKDIPDNSVDCVICDLPYGSTRNSWDSVLPLDELWSQYKRIIKPTGAICLFAQQPFTSILVTSNIKMFKYEWIWEKTCSTGWLNCKFAPLKKHESILVFSKSAACHVKDKSKACTYNPQFTSGKAYTLYKEDNSSTNYDTKCWKSFTTVNDGEHYYPTDIIKFKRDADSFHPTQKPVELVRYLIRTYSNPGEVILDCCMGSGTTAIASIREKRKYIGFELDWAYFKKANDRIFRETQQLKIDF